MSDSDAALVDLGRLAQWMDAAGHGSGPIEHARLLTGGTQNILLRFARAGRGYVLRRPPRHPRSGSGSTLQREARVLAALAGSGVPHPGFIDACPDPGVIGAPFMLMEPVDGFNASNQGLPPLHAGDRSIRHAMGLSMVDAIARLGNLDPHALGLGDLGKPEGFLQRQVKRWQAQLDAYAEERGWPGPSALPAVADMGAWLDANVPKQGAPGLIHGDFHLANVMFRHGGPELAAVVDWEMATVGDPLLDLGWLLATWPRPDGSHHLSHNVRPWDGFPVAEELVSAYALRSRRDVAAVRWFAVLACFKLAIVLEGTHARACGGRAPADTGTRLHRAAVGLLQRGAGWIVADGPFGRCP